MWAGTKRRIMNLKDWHIILILLLLSCAFFLNVLANPGKIMFSSYFSDVISYHSGYEFFIANTWRKFSALPLWNPYTFAGQPFIGNPQLPLFYPLNFLYLVFSTNSLFGYIFLLDVFLIGIFTYLFAKDLGITKIGALVSAIVFMFSGYVVLHIYAGHTTHLDVLAWMPLAFLLLERAIKKKSIFYGLMTGVPVGLQILAGHIQLAFYVSASLMIYFLLRVFFIFKHEKSIKKTTKLIFIFLSCFIIAFSLSAIQLFPMIELFGNLVRTEPEITGQSFTGSYSLPPLQLITFLMPEFFGTFLDNTYWGGQNFWELALYVGIFPLLLAISASISIFSKNSHKKQYKIIFLLLAIITILYALGKHLPIYQFLQNIPFFSFFRKPSVVLFLSAFSLSILSGFGFDILQRKDIFKNKKFHTLIKILPVILVLTLSAFLFVYTQKELITSIGEKMLKAKYEKFGAEVHIPKYDLDYYMQKIPEVYNRILNGLLSFSGILSLVIGTLYLRRKEKISAVQFKVLILLIILFDVWFFGIKYIQVEDPNKVFAERCPTTLVKNDEFYRTFDTLDLTSHRKITDCFSQFISMRYEVETIWGYESIVLKRYRELTDPSLNLFNGNMTTVNLDPKVLGMLNVKYVITSEPIGNNNFVLAWQGQINEREVYLPTEKTKEIYIYENKQVLPRAFIVHSARVIKDDQNAIEEIMSSRFDPKEYVILHEDVDVRLESTGGFEPAEITYFSPNEFHIKVNATSPGFLVLSQNWQPGWEIYDNDNPKRFYRADYTLGAVHLDSGDHYIRFVYRPTSLIIGFYITLITVMFLIVILFKSRRSTKNDRIKICVACSAGGHLTEVLQIKKCFESFPNFFITFKREDTKELSKEEKVYFVEDPKRSLISFLKCVLQTSSVLYKERPNIVISTGAGVGVVACYLAKLVFGAKIIFIESFCRIETPSLSGKLVYPIANLFFVQWEELLQKYGKKAMYRGDVL